MRDCRNILKYHTETDSRLVTGRAIVKEFRICTQYAIDAWSTKEDWLKTAIQRPKQLFIAPETLHATHCTIEAFAGEGNHEKSVMKEEQGMHSDNLHSVLSTHCTTGYLAQLCKILPDFMRDTGTRWPTTVRTAVMISWFDHATCRDGECGTDALALLNRIL